MKKKILVPLGVFLLGICLSGLLGWKTDTHEKEQRRTTAQLNATTYGERIKNEITNGIEITDALKQVLISEDGEINHFDTIAENLKSDSIESVRIAPDGIVTDIYPAEGNEAGKIDLLHDKDRSKISCYARDNHTLITQGPFELKQSGYGIAVRNPIYLKNADGQEYFWGFTIVILRVPGIFSDSIDALSNFGYEYRLSKKDIPWSDDYKVVYQSDGQMTAPVSYEFTIGEEKWRFEVTPKSGYLSLEPHFLIFDEYVAFMEMLNTREREDVLNKLKQIVMLGRQVGFFLILACQRPDAKYLGDGIRDQFNFRVALGRMSELGYSMMFGEVKKEFFFKNVKGCGYADTGKGVITEFYTPVVPKGYDFLREIGTLAAGLKQVCSDRDIMEDLQ